MLQVEGGGGIQAFPWPVPGITQYVESTFERLKRKKEKQPTSSNEYIIVLVSIRPIHIGVLVAKLNEYILYEF